ncbi:MAG: cytochrome P450 [Alphaproteobacteria bacterium]
MSVAAIDASLDSIDVSDPQLYQDDTWYEPFRRLRDEDPIHYCPESQYGPYWSVTRYDDIMKVELDHATYASGSEHGGIQIRDQPAGQELPNFIRMDPPRHTAQRKTVAPIVGPGHLAKFEQTIRERTDYVLNDLPRAETFDWVDRVSVELTTMMLATLFDFPWEDRRLLPYWSDVAIADINDPHAPVHTNDERMAELIKMADYFADLWRARAAAPPKFDLISMLAHGASTQAMSRNEFIGNIALLIVGGNDTTRNTMSGGLLALAENPDQEAKLRSDPSLVTKMMLETIRYQTPVIHMRRTATVDVELGGKPIKAGDKVVMWYVSGNRDERAMPEPDRFIIDRDKPRRHLAFGAGIHRCVGDRLAELQLQVLWEEILKRDLRIEVMGEPERVYSNFLRGIRKLPVRIAA